MSRKASASVEPAADFLDAAVFVQDDNIVDVHNTLCFWFPKQMYIFPVQMRIPATVADYSNLCVIGKR